MLPILALAAQVGAKVLKSKAAKNVGSKIVGRLFNKRTSKNTGVASPLVVGSGLASLSAASNVPGPLQNSVLPDSPGGGLPEKIGDILGKVTAPSREINTTLTADKSLYYLVGAVVLGLFLLKGK